MPASFPSVANFSLRSATKSDFPAVRSLIHQVGINPIGLDWKRFWLAVDGPGRIIGCAQIKPHRDGSYELASLAVVAEWRGQGVARALIEKLVQEYFSDAGLSQGKPLYLTCRAGLGPFYQRFNFQAISPSEMPPYFKRIYRLVNIGMKLSPPSEGLFIMRRKPPE